jgi:putative addiction module killer protein
VQPTPREILICQDDSKQERFTEWFLGLDPVTLGRVQAHIDRVEDGNFKHVESVGGGVSELKMDFGPGYRAYFGQKGDEVHMICGGKKKGQQADIDFAKEFWSKHE